MSDQQHSSEDVWACRLPKPTTKDEKAAIRERISRATPKEYFALSACPITKEIEDSLEQASLAVTQEEYGNEFFAKGIYVCTQCSLPLYSHTEKFTGPCIWPSFRAPITQAEAQEQLSDGNHASILSRLDEHLSTHPLTSLSDAGPQDGVLHTRRVEGYNKYTCEVREVYCAGCKLFMGHMFEDGKEHGDTHPAAQWRHCVLSLSLTFVPL